MTESEAIRIAEGQSPVPADEEAAAFQMLLESGRVWTLTGRAGRRCMELIGDGKIRQKGVAKALPADEAEHGWRMLL
jgi:hypothetical protein